MQDESVKVKGHGCIIALLCIIAIPFVLWILGSVVIVVFADDILEGLEKSSHITSKR